MTQLQRAAGVTARHHDLRELGDDLTAWTAVALAASGTTTPHPRAASAAKGGPKGGAKGGPKGGPRGAGPRGKRFQPHREGVRRRTSDQRGSGDSPWTAEPRRSGPPVAERAGSRKPRWSKNDRDSRG